MHICTIRNGSSQWYFFHESEIMFKSSLHVIDQILVKDPTSHIDASIGLESGLDMFGIEG